MRPGCSSEGQRESDFRHYLPGSLGRLLLLRDVFRTVQNKAFALPGLPSPRLTNRFSIHSEVTRRSENPFCLYYPARAISRINLDTGRD